MQAFFFSYAGKPSPKSIKKDIQVVYQFLTRVLEVPSKNIILFGRSIGIILSTSCMMD
jgi:hypothetical protein